MSISANSFIRGLLSVTLLVMMLAMTVGVAQAQTNPNVRPPEDAQTWGGSGDVPATVMPQPSDSMMWRQIRRGLTGTVSIPNKQAGQLVQSEGDNWRAIRNGPLSVYGGWLMLATIVVLAVFFLVRGRIRIDKGASGRTVERFNGIERFAHWLLAVSFIVLALSGLNMLYGRYVLLPVIGPDVFAALTLWGKYAHNFLAFSFMVGVVMVFVLWIRENIPNRHDLTWLAKGGGLLVKGSHPPARKFNAGQKIVFWAVVLGGISISLSGIALLFPFQFELFAPTYAILNIFGLGLETEMTMVHEMQLAQMWHVIVGLVLIAIIIAHIYIGTLGMEGAFDAMGTGKVDENWAQEHHPIWVEEMKAQPAAKGAAPAAAGAAQTT